MLEIQMIQALQVVIANEVKQSHGIAASSRQGGTPRNDHILLFRPPARGMARRGGGRNFNLRNSNFRIWGGFQNDEN